MPIANSIELQTLVCYFWALSLVPPDKIIPVWEYFIEDRYNEMKPAFEDEVEAVEEWLGYVERTYIGVINGRTGNRKAPMFFHSLWIKYSHTCRNTRIWGTRLPKFQGLTSPGANLTSPG